MISDVDQDISLRNTLQLVNSQPQYIKACHSHTSSHHLKHNPWYHKITQKYRKINLHGHTTTAQSQPSASRPPQSPNKPVKIDLIRRHFSVSDPGEISYQKITNNTRATRKKHWLIHPRGAQVQIKCKTDKQFSTSQQ